jgi:hypothetical protein
MLLGLGSLLIAIGILTVPHHATIQELSAQMSEGGPTTIGGILVALGALLGVVGFLMGKVGRK